MGGSDSSARPVAVFFANVPATNLFELIEFYAEDIRALEAMGFDVRPSNSILEAMTSQGDLLYAWWFHSSLPVVVAWRMRRRPAFVTGATHYAERRQSRKLQDRIWVLLTYLTTRLATVNIAISETERAALTTMNVPRLYTLTCSVDTTFYRPGPKTPHPTAITIAQLTPQSITRKGVGMAIDAAKLIHETNPEFRLVIVGLPTPEGEAAVLRRIDGSEAITLAGELSRDAKQLALSRSWYYLQPSLNEGFGVAVLEAMACGSVPICSDAGALPELVSDAGVIIPEISPARIAEVMRGYFGNRGATKDLQAAARARAEIYDSARHRQDMARIMKARNVLRPVS